MAECLIIICVVAIVLILLSEYKIDIKKKTYSLKEKEQTAGKKEKKVARVGKSIPDIRQMMSLDDSYLKAEDVAKKENTFDPSQNESDPDPKDLVIDADPTETVIDEEEDIAAYTGEEVYSAGGMDYDVMMNTVGVINSKTATKEEEQKAGEVLHENRDTELVGKMRSTKGALATRITSLIDIRTQEYANSIEAGVASHSNESEEYKNFNANDFF